MPLVNLGTVFINTDEIVSCTFAYRDADIVFKNGERMKLIGESAAKLLAILKEKAPRIYLTE
jgi:hypothetical protein